MASNIYLDGLDWDLSSNRVARGDDSSAIVQVGSVVTTDEFGVDMFTLPVDVRRDLVPDFLPLPGNLDPIYEKLIFVDRTVTHGGDRSKINAKFNGFLTERELEPTRAWGQTERTVALRGAGGITLNVTYISPALGLTYALPNDPEATTFKGEVSIPVVDAVQVPGYEILDIRATGGDLDFGIDPETWGWADFTTNGYLWTAVVRTTAFTREQAAPKAAVWRIREEHSGIVIPKNEI